eukprot:CAMPEP_0170063058 /NCGR_PEP_ID=MMETSP0019_2-20121128/4068_1 /TAXON_ID=98059 /ORGANISM="Dinobryon sp., Strain UTEXLB2267" /LENGTH=228 /DNA_ID=CAMNT_0010269393 /DNA_START=217 /DNA_END=900 /DNA_ORIENTATION=+
MVLSDGNAYYTNSSIVQAANSNVLVSTPNVKAPPSYSCSACPCEILILYSPSSNEGTSTTEQQSASTDDSNNSTRRVSIEAVSIIIVVLVLICFGIPCGLTIYFMYFSKRVPRYSRSSTSSSSVMPETPAMLMMMMADAFVLEHPQSLPLTEVRICHDDSPQGVPKPLGWETGDSEGSQQVSVPSAEPLNFQSLYNSDIPTAGCEPFGMITVTIAIPMDNFLITYLFI